MTVRSIARVHELVRSRMPELTDEDIVAVAHFVWAEAHAVGVRGGADWRAFVAALPGDTGDYSEVVRT